MSIVTDRWRTGSWLAVVPGLLVSAVLLLVGGASTAAGTRIDFAGCSEAEQKTLRGAFADAEALAAIAAAAISDPARQAAARGGRWPAYSYERFAESVARGRRPDAWDPEAW